MKRLALCLVVALTATFVATSMVAAKPASPKTGDFQGRGRSGGDIEVERAGIHAFTFSKLEGSNENPCFEGGKESVFGASELNVAAFVRLRKPIPVVDGRFKFEGTKRFFVQAQGSIKIMGRISGTFVSATKVVGTWSAVESGSGENGHNKSHCNTGSVPFSAKWVSPNIVG